MPLPDFVLCVWYFATYGPIRRTRQSNGRLNQQGRNGYPRKCRRGRFVEISVDAIAVDSLCAGHVRFAAGDPFGFSKKMSSAAFCLTPADRRKLSDSRNFRQGLVSQILIKTTYGMPVEIWQKRFGKFSLIFPTIETAIRRVSQLSLASVETCCPKVRSPDRGGRRSGSIATYGRCFRTRFARG